MTLTSSQRKLLVVVRDHPGKVWHEIGEIAYGHLLTPNSREWKASLDGLIELEAAGLVRTNYSYDHFITLDGHSALAGRKISEEENDAMNDIHSQSMTETDR